MGNGFERVTPCGHCPFRNDRDPYLTLDRAEEISDSLRMGAEFPCHKTIEHDEDGEGIRSKDSQFCAGALIILEKGKEPNQMMRVGERLGLYDYNKLDLINPPVYDDLDEWVMAHEEM